MTDAAQAVRDLLHVPSDYHVLYLHGGAHAVFAALPLNLAGDHASADYVRVCCMGSCSAPCPRSHHGRVVVCVCNTHAPRALDCPQSWWNWESPPFLHRAPTVMHAPTHRRW